MHLTMVSDHDTQYEENPSSHHGGIHEDGLTDGLDPILYSPDSAYWGWSMLQDASTY